MKIGIKFQSLIPIFIYCFSAEKQGFEPWEQLPVHRISSAARSTTPASPGTSRYNGFQDRRNRPLCHLSKLLCQVLLFFKSDAKVRIIFEYASIWAKKVRGKEIFAKICLSLPRYNLIKRGL